MLEDPVFRPIFKNLNSIDPQILDTKTQLWKAVWVGKQFGKTWTTMPMECGHPRHTESKPGHQPVEWRLVRRILDCGGERERERELKERERERA